MTAFQYAAARSQIAHDHARKVAVAKQEPRDAQRRAWLRSIDDETRAAIAKLDKEAGITR